MELHGIPWNCSCQRNWHILSSMEFHGTARVSEIGVLLVPWNSMDFHGTARVIEIGILLVPWNSMEFHRTAPVIEIGALQVPWNSMELLVSAKLAHSKLYGIPWNCSCQRNWRTWSSMEFHEIPWNCWCQRIWRTWSSMEFHGIPLNCSCHRKWRTWNFMEFHGTARVIEIGALLVSWNSMKFHGTARVIEIGTPSSMEFHGTAGVSSMEFHETYCFYLMEPLVSSIHWVLKWDRIPWNLSYQILMKIVFNSSGWINFPKLINTLYLFAISFTNWCFIINICIIPYAFPALLITYQNIIQNLFSMLIETYFDQKFHGTFSRVPWNFLNNIWTTPVVPWNSMELFPYSRVPWNSMEYHGTFNFPSKSSKEFHGIPWNFFEVPWNSMELDKIHI